MMAETVQRVDMDDDEHREMRERIAELCRQQAEIEDKQKKKSRRRRGFLRRR